LGSASSKKEYDGKDKAKRMMAIHKAQREELREYTKNPKLIEAIREIDVIHPKVGQVIRLLLKEIKGDKK